MWNLPGRGTKPVSLPLAGGFLFTETTGKSSPWGATHGPSWFHGHQQQLILLHTDRCGSLSSLLGKPRRFYWGHFSLTSGCLPREVSDLRDSDPVFTLAQFHCLRMRVSWGYCGCLLFFWLHGGCGLPCGLPHPNPSKQICWKWVASNWDSSFFNLLLQMLFIFIILYVLLFLVGQMTIHRQL